MKATRCLVLIFVFLTGQGWSSDHHSSLGYMDVGVLLPVAPVPSVGLGYRVQAGHNGGDFSIHASSNMVFTQIKGAILYQYYFHPNLDSQFYLGSGLGISWVEYHLLTVERGFCVSPEFVFGKQFKLDTGTSRFWQFQMSVPTYSIQDSAFFGPGRGFYLPVLAFYYGFCF
jgi:hypothetical protein